MGERRTYPIPHRRKDFGLTRRRHCPVSMALNWVFHLQGLWFPHLQNENKDPALAGFMPALHKLWSFGRGEPQLGKGLHTIKRDHWCNLSNSWRPSIEGVHEDSWHHEESPGEAMVKVQLNDKRLPPYLEMPAAGDDPRVPRTAFEWSQPELETICVCSRGWRQRNDLWRRPEDHEWIPDMEHWFIYTSGVWFDFDLIVTGPRFFPLGIRKYLFLILLEPTVEKLWTFKEVLEFYRDFMFKRTLNIFKETTFEVFECVRLRDI